MGTLPLVESFFDARNLGTVVAYAFLLALGVKAFTTENKQQSMALLMVRAFFLMQTNILVKESVFTNNE